jgi:type IV pilus assembly protein PilQ
MTKADALAKLGQEPSYNGKRVTFNFQDIPVRSALQLIADVSKLNLVASDSVGGSVTLRLVNVPWDQALDVILRAKSLDKRRNGNVIWIAPQAELAKYEQDHRRCQAEGAGHGRAGHRLRADQLRQGKDIAKLLTTGSMQAHRWWRWAAAVQYRARLSVIARQCFVRRTHQHAVAQRHAGKDQAAARR